MKSIRVENLNFKYNTGDDFSLKDINFKVSEGEFVLLTGGTGFGKTTLLRLLKKEIAPLGKMSGKIETDGNVGFVFQNPDSQIVCDTVRGELSFGLENMGMPTNMIQRRVAETAIYFGIENLMERETFYLSGGEKQLVNLASIVAMKHDFIVLDEPISQLDPRARKDFLYILLRVNLELGIAVILSSHILPDILDKAKRVMYMKDGSLDFDGNRDEFVDYVLEKEEKFKEELPRCVLEVASLVNKGNDINGEKYAYTIKDARSILVNGKKKDVHKAKSEEKCKECYVENKSLSSTDIDKKAGKSEDDLILLTAKNLWFKYEKNTNFVIRSVDMEIASGKIYGIVGGNGSGKSTLLALLSGKLSSNRGKVVRKGKATLVPQNPRAMFRKMSVAEEIEEALGKDLDRDIKDSLIEIIKISGLDKRRETHPGDLSGGEQQILSLIIATSKNPGIILLDEAVKGMDASLKIMTGDLLRHLAAKGRSVVLVTHDLEFAERFADEISFLFDGEVVANEKAGKFFEENMLFTTDRVRIFR